MTSRVDNQSLRAYLTTVTFRHVFAMMIAIAMLFAPFSMKSGSAMAAMPSDHHGQTNANGHCGNQPRNGMADKAIGKSCCAAMCTAVAVTPASPIVPLIFPRTVERPTLSLSPHSYLASLATPPPRTA